MALTPEEQAQLQKVQTQIEGAVNDIGEAIKNGSTTVARSALRMMRNWLEDLEKTIEKKP